MLKYFYYRYYMTSMFEGEEPSEITEDDFWELVGTNRKVVPMEYDCNDINRQNFFLNGELIAFRIKCPFKNGNKEKK